MMMTGGRKLCDSIPGDAPIRFHHESIVDVSLQRLWSFYMSPDALRRLSPPLSWFRVLEPGSGVADGSVLVATVGPWPLQQRWVALHAGIREEQSFTDIALESPFAHWVHLHGFEPVDDGHSRLIDVVWFLPPRGVPRWAGRLFAGGPLRWMFWWRHRTSARAARATVTDSKEQPAAAIRRASAEVRT